MPIPSRDISDLGERSYSTAVDGGSPVVVRMTVSGDLGGHYLDFAADRAAWLSLSGWVESRSKGQAIVVAAGPEALVGALEMACLLGPVDAVVDTIEISDEAGPVAPGFAVRR